jgi:hypothetical protein
MADYERDHEHQHLFAPYYRAVRLFGEHTAAVVFQHVAAVLHAHPDCELSAFRFTLEETFHVAVLGEPPSREVAYRLDNLLLIGQPVELPRSVLRALAERRLLARSPAIRPPRWASLIGWMARRCEYGLYDRRLTINVLRLIPIRRHATLHADAPSIAPICKGNVQIVLRRCQPALLQ